MINFLLVAVVMFLFAAVMSEGPYFPIPNVLGLVGISLFALWGWARENGAR